MRDDLKNTTAKRDAERGPETLKFYFTPTDELKEKDVPNPHAKETTYAPDVVEALKSRFGEDVYDVKLYANEHTVLVRTERIVEICRYLKQELGFRYLTDLAGVDRFTDEDRFEVYYVLVSFERRKRIRLKVRASEDNPVVPSISDVFRAANWYEREGYDMLGVRFEGNPDLRRIYLPEDFEYFPQRKEFPTLGIPGSLPLPPRFPEGDLSLDPFPSAHGNRPIKSYEEPTSNGKHE